jgi:outer membrane protein OmpA-like peptidoglycan-associated protein
VRIGTRLPERESGDVAIELTRRLYHSALLALALVLGSAIAEAATDISETALDRYDPAPPGDALLWLPDASVDGNAELDAGARFSYARSPLRLRTAAGSEQIVSYQLIAHALLAAELARRFKLLLDAPFVVSQDGPASNRFGTPSGAAIGDLRLDTRAELVAARGVWPAGALELELRLPTGNGDYAGDPSARYGVATIVGANLDRWLWRARFGVRYRHDESEAAGIFGSEAHVGLGIGLSWERALFGVELAGATGFESKTGFFAKDTTQLEALASAQYRFGPLTALVGGGPGLTRGAGTPAYRVIFGVEVAHELAPTRRTSISDRDTGSRKSAAARGDDRPRARGGSIPQARFVGTSIVISEQIHFAVGKDQLLSESFGVLGEVAKLLAAHPEIARVSVDGHTDDVGDDAENLRLSRRRALAVVRWLVEHGIDERRLEARGFGARQPLVVDKTEEARSKNRRVEFRIKRQTDLGRRGWRDGAVDE